MRCFEPKQLIGKECKLHDSTYVISDYLGGGGVGVTYVACNQQNNRKLCVKVLNPAERFELNQHITHRFCREANIAKKLSHDKLVKVFDVGKVDNKYYFYSMEYCSGGNLKTFLRQHKYGYWFGNIWQIFIQICESLNYIHKQGYIHRDLKPDNILLSNPCHFLDGSVNIKISDYGTFYNFQDQLENIHTYSHDIIGSLIYISPEQRLRKDVTIQSDIYSLGVILYQLLIGDTYEYRLKPLKAVRGLEDHQRIVVQNIINRMCENDLKFRYKSVKEVLFDFKTKLIDNDSFLAKRVQIPAFVSEPVRNISLDFESSNIYHKINIIIPKYEDELWRFPDEDDKDYYDYPTEPIIQDNLVFVGWLSGYLSSVFLSTGDLNWEKELTDNKLMSTPVSVQNKCLVIDEVGQLFCLECFSGDIMWTVNLEGDFSCPLKVVGNILYAISNDGRIFQVDIDNGVFKEFRYEITKTIFNHRFNQIISSANSLYFLTDEKIVGIPDISRFDASENRYWAWQYHCPFTEYNNYYWDSDGLAGFSCDNRNLYATTYRGMAICIDPESGTSIWRIETDEDISSGPFASDDFLVFITCKGNLYICDKYTGATLRKRSVHMSWTKEESSYGTPIYTRENLLVFGDYIIKVLDNTLQKELFSWEVGKEPRPLPTFSGDIVLISSDYGIQAFK